MAITTESAVLMDSFVRVDNKSGVSSATCERAIGHHRSAAIAHRNGR
ncbi:MAG: hypothetical protein QNJ06_19555 [Kiloniellales bacterium]|nr:hypothetical protein [Kiloniellales bacterium]